MEAPIFLVYDAKVYPRVPYELNEFANEMKEQWSKNKYKYKINTTFLSPSELQFQSNALLTVFYDVSADLSRFKSDISCAYVRDITQELTNELLTFYNNCDYILVHTNTQQKFFKKLDIPSRRIVILGFPTVPTVKAEKRDETRDTIFYHTVSQKSNIIEQLKKYNDDEKTKLVIYNPFLIEEKIEANITETSDPEIHRKVKDKVFINVSNLSIPYGSENIFGVSYVCRESTNYPKGVLKTDGLSEDAFTTHVMSAFNNVLFNSSATKLRRFYNKQIYYLFDKLYYQPFRSRKKTQKEKKEIPLVIPKHKGKACKEIKGKNIFTLKPHQTRSFIEFTQNNKKGMLFYHGLGSGKTCQALTIADNLLNMYEEKYKTVHVFSPPAVTEEIITDYCETCGEDPTNLKDKYNFYNYHISDITTRLNLDNSVIIVDEVHNIIREVVNKTSVGNDNRLVFENSVKVAIYQSIIAATNCKVILLSGTPLWSSNMDLLILSRMLDTKHIFPLNVEKCLTIFEDENLVAEKLQHYISYVEPISNETEEGYPKIIYKPFVMCQMTGTQLSVYARIKAYENHLRRIKQRRGRGNVDYFLNVRTDSQMACNFVYPYEKKGLHRKLNANIEKEDLKPMWLSDDVYKNMGEYSEKFRRLLINVIKGKGKQVVYTHFVEKCGMFLLNSMFEKCGLNPIMFRGNRTEIDAFNSIDNLHGEKNKVLLLSKMGGTGINLLAVRDIHIVEPQINENETIQAVGRAARRNSHILLDKKDRVVRVWKYLSVLPSETLTEYTLTKGKEYFINEKESTDFTIQVHAREKQEKVEFLLNALKKSSFDCSFSSVKDCLFPVQEGHMEKNIIVERKI